LEIQEYLSEIPLFNNKEITVTALSGGLANDTYKISCEGKKYVLRIFGKQNEYLQLTRGSELDVIEVMKPIANCPTVIYRHTDNKFVLLDYIEGRPLNRDDLLNPDIVQQIIGQMRDIHNSVKPLQVSNRQCSPFQLIERYLQGADQLGVKHPDGLTEQLHKLELIAKKQSSNKRYTNKYCHNDFYLFNIILSPDNQKTHVLDWELSGIGDIFFDLATIPFTNRFDPSQDKAWLKAYFGYFERDQYEILQDMKFVNMLRECTWGLLHSGMNEINKSNNPFNYYKHAEHVIKRLQQGYYYF
jgi:thiamine kinase-like enzyme